MMDTLKTTNDDNVFSVGATTAEQVVNECDMLVGPGVFDVIGLVCSIVLAIAALASWLLTARANREASRNNAAAAKLNKTITELNIRQAIASSHEEIAHARRELDKFPDNATCGRNLTIAMQSLLNIYETICRLKKDEIESEDFWTFYGHEIQLLVQDKMFKKLIPDSGEAYKYIRETVQRLNCRSDDAHFKAKDAKTAEQPEIPF